MKMGAVRCLGLRRFLEGGLRHQPPSEQSGFGKSLDVRHRPLATLSRDMKTARLLLTLSLLTALPSPAAEMPRMFFEQHCADCHDADEKKGGLYLTALKPGFADGDAREVTVTSPDLGEVKLQARADGAVYLASLKAGKLSLTKTDF